MFNVTELALFLLATVNFNGVNYKGQRFPTYWESRIVPIKQTWGSFFPMLYFVFGNSQHDHRFMLRRCKHISSVGDSYSHKRYRNSTDLFECPVALSDSMWNISKYINMSTSDAGHSVASLYNSYQTRRRFAPVQALYTANCTGTYFGIGPTCRCQEAMRYFMTQSAFAHVKWFAFMDDDLHYRPYALLSMLQTLQSTPSYVATYVDAPAVLTSAIAMRGFAQLTNKLGRNKSHSCTDPTVHRFMYAQPAFMNRLAMDRLSTAIHASALTSLHRHWGGSHDSLLGLLLWSHQIPIYGMDKFYCGIPVYIHVWDENNNVIRSSNNVAGDQCRSNCSIFHRVMSRIMFKKGVSGGQMQPVHEIASQYDIAECNNEAILYNNDAINEASLKQIAQEQIRLGKISAESLMHHEQYTVNRTIFAKNINDLLHRYVDFTPSDCPLLTGNRK